MFISIVMLNTQVVAGEAEDVVIARAVIDSLTAADEAREAAKEASRRASLRAVAALGVVYNCDKCTLLEIMSAENYDPKVEKAYDILVEWFYKEESAE